MPDFILAPGSDGGQDFFTLGAGGRAEGEAGIMRLGTAIIMYRRHMGPVLRVRTLRQQTYTLEAFHRHTGNMALRAVRTKHVQGWVATMDVQASTIRTRLSTLRTFFRWCCEQRHLKLDPMIGVRVPRQPRQAPRSMPLSDLRALGTALPDKRATLIVALMLDMGLRAGEVAGLEMADIDLYAGVMRVTGKGGHERLLPIVDSVRYYMDAYLGERGRGGGPLIRSLRSAHRGINAQTVGQLVSRWMRDAGVKHSAYDGRSAHALRHTMAENLFRHGVDLRTIAAAMGHASPTTTWIYLRHQAHLQDLRDAMGQQIIEEERPALRPVRPHQPPNMLLRKEAG